VSCGIGVAVDVRDPRTFGPAENRQ